MIKIADLKSQDGEAAVARNAFKLTFMGAISGMAVNTIIGYCIEIYKGIGLFCFLNVTVCALYFRMAPY